MSQEESRSQVKKIIRTSKSGKEITEAMIQHFRIYAPKTPVVKRPEYEEALAELNAPLFRTVA